MSAKNTRFDGPQTPEFGVCGLWVHVFTHDDLRKLVECTGEVCASSVGTDDDFFQGHAALVFDGVASAVYAQDCYSSVDLDTGLRYQGDQFGGWRTEAWVVPASCKLSLVTSDESLIEQARALGIPVVGHTPHYYYASRLPRIVSDVRELAHLALRIEQAQYELDSTRCASQRVFDAQEYYDSLIDSGHAEQSAYDSTLRRVALEENFVADLQEEISTWRKRVAALVDEHRLLLNELEYAN